MINCSQSPTHWPSSYALAERKEVFVHRGREGASILMGNGNFPHEYVRKVDLASDRRVVGVGNRDSYRQFGA